MLGRARLDAARPDRDAVSSLQLGEWLAEWGVPPAPVVALPISVVVPGAQVDGPVPELAAEMKELHRRRFA